MGKIKNSMKEIFTTTDGNEYMDMDRAKSHQMAITAKGISEDLVDFVTELFKLPSQNLINDLYDSEKDGDYEKGTELEEKISDFLNNQCDSMGFMDEMIDVTEILVDIYQSFGLEKLSDIFMFIDNKMDM